jgi:hypothetical protein
VHIYTELYSTAFNKTISFGYNLRKHKTGYSVNKFVTIFVTDETSINLDYTKSINFVHSLTSIQVSLAEEQTLYRASINIMANVETKTVKFGSELGI